MNQRRFLITGGQGCVGAWVAKNLVQAGDPTLVYDLDLEPRRMALLMKPEEIASITFIRGDITDGEQLTQVIGDNGITRIIHLAALQHPDCHANPIRGAQINVIGTLNVFEAAKRFPDQVQQLVYASSSAAMGPEEAYEVIGDNGITRIIHLAALQHPDCHANPIRGAQINVIGTLNVFEAAKRFPDQVQQLVYASSSAAMGPEEAYEVMPVPDDAPLFPASYYGVFKACNEESARIYWLNERLSSIGLRPGVLYGPGRDQGRSADLTVAIKAGLAGQQFHIDFGGRINAQFVDDVAKAFIACAKAEHKGASTFNLRGIVASIPEFVAEIERQIPSARGLITHGQEHITAPSDVDDKGLRGLIGQAPITPLADGIAQTRAIFQQMV
jgi:nucleoside-diphosphate-sugar epimerase